ncbi:hypothetical protein BGZ49_009194 [Haplosporangium sp. Z 27]|nr:hypothetical protein BGZ49_009194 [Haplosporangium sp. Z 27]
MAYHCSKESTSQVTLFYFLDLAQIYFIPFIPFSMKARFNELLFLLTLQTLLAGAISLALAAGTADEALDEIVWKDKLLQDWDNGWDVDINDNPVNINAACFGMPCTRFKLVKLKNVEICVTPSGRRHVCSSNYEKSTFVYPPGPDEFDEYGYYDKDDVIRSPDYDSDASCY